MKVICNKLDKCQIESCPHNELHKHDIGCSRDICDGTQERVECVEIKDTAPESRTTATKRAIKSLEVAISFSEFGTSELNMVELDDGTAKDILQLLESYLADQK